MGTVTGMMSMPALPVVHTDGSERNLIRDDDTEYDGMIHEKTLKAQEIFAAKGSRGGPKPKPIVGDKS